MLNKDYVKNQYLNSEDLNKVIASGSTGSNLVIEFHLYPDSIDPSWTNGHFEDGIKAFAKANR